MGFKWYFSPKSHLWSLKALEIQASMRSIVIPVADWLSDRGSYPLHQVLPAPGRDAFFPPVKSENGKGTTTTSPFTNLSKLHPPQHLANPLPIQIHLR